MTAVLFLILLIVSVIQLPQEPFQKLEDVNTVVLDHMLLRTSEHNGFVLCPLKSSYLALSAI